MAHYHVEGTLVVARLSRRLLGGAVYKDVTIHQADGSHRKVGTVTALNDMKSAMVPGSRGRFYFYEVLGTRGIYGSRRIGARAHASFPYRWDLLTGGLGLLNLLMALIWHLEDGRIALLAIAVGILCLVMAVLFLKTRIEAMRAYRKDDPKAPDPSELGAADAAV